MLDQLRGDHRQLFDLVAHRLPHREKLTRGKDVAALAALGPVLDHLIDR
ncbi:MAG: hypothetical protein ACLQMH_14580 [Solirubrobacteraceae bacterium]